MNATKTERITTPNAAEDKYVTEATCVLHGVADMTKDERDGLAGWLRDLARDVVDEGDRYAHRMTARKFRRKR